MNNNAITVERVADVCHIFLSGNALGRQEATELVDIARELVEDRGLLAVILDSADADFCPGPAPDLDPLLESTNPTLALSRIRVPVIAVLRGQVASVGLEVALTADLRLSHPGARYAMPDVSQGRLPSWGGTQRLPRVIGGPMSLYLLLLSEELSAERAHELGLVHEVVEEPESHAETLVSQWRKRGPLALEYAKEAVLNGAELSLRAGLSLEADLNALLQTSADRQEGLAAFRDKRDPRFSGQ